ncbi:hypothetical protein [Lysinibacillus sp. ACHW1.5]|uniref:hypothetical protein n=1 Tax=Lysinibacillus sp. ACHW1.5 TaxID=2913506 RepID=UPI001EDAC841|nr:hypothetical protein [Lysinibacillus sp. ACHW1.5]UKJ43439.1 hypothetical protein L6W14_11710 [Lysinibacillus sp. ACHW1.5]
MVTKAFTSTESTSRSQTLKITIPNLTKVISVKANTGNAVVTSINGNEVTISLSGGSSTRSVQTGGTYTPAQTKTGVAGGSVSPGDSIPSTMPYSDGQGFHGTLSLKSASAHSDGGSNGRISAGSCPAVLPNTGGAIKTSYCTYSYEGTVTKPAVDTRTYAYYYQYVVTVDYEDNKAPTVTVTGPTNNITLYENDTLNVTGTAIDQDPDQSVTVYYQIDNNPKKVLATNLSQIQISLSKQLTFKGGKLFDGEIVLTDTLAEGVPHTLKVWAVDNEGAQSETVERTFYVVPNRAPLLAIDSVVPSGIINTDKFKISGTASDQDANSNIKVNYRINGANPVEVYNGAGGAWEFEVFLSQLVVNENTIIIEVIDNYDAKTSKTIKLNKNEVKTPILHAVGRYKIKPPAGSAKGVLLFIERDEEMNLKVELSMTLAGEQEQYETLTADNTAPMPNMNGIVEDTYYYEATEPKDNIILKLSTTLPDANVNHKIHLISGAVE